VLCHVVITLNVQAAPAAGNHCCRCAAAAISMPPSKGAALPAALPAPLHVPSPQPASLLVQGAGEGVVVAAAGMRLPAAAAPRSQARLLRARCVAHAAPRGRAYLPPGSMVEVRPLRRSDSQ